MKIYKYHKININLLNSLQKKKNWYSAIDQLNDPFDTYLIDKTPTATYLNLRKRFYVCCFSKNMNNLLMWSHYADSHKGVCLEWEIDESKKSEALHEIIYENSITILEEVKTHPSGTLLLNVGTNGRFILRKFKAWEYEEEIRIINMPKVNNYKGLYKDFPGKLTAIYFGRNVNDDDLELVISNSKHLPGVKFFRTDLDPNTMKNDKIIQI